MCLLSRWWSFNRVKIISRYLVCLPIHKILSHQILFSCRCWYYWWWSSHERDECRSVIKIKINAESLSLWNHTSSFFSGLLHKRKNNDRASIGWPIDGLGSKKQHTCNHPGIIQQLSLYYKLVSYEFSWKKSAQLPIWRRFLIKYLWKSPSYPYLN